MYPDNPTYFRRKEQVVFKAVVPNHCLGLWPHFDFTNYFFFSHVMATVSQSIYIHQSERIQLLTRIIIIWKFIYIQDILGNSIWIPYDPPPGPDHNVEKHRSTPWTKTDGWPCSDLPSVPSLSRWCECEVKRCFLSSFSEHAVSADFLIHPRWGPGDARVNVMNLLLHFTIRGGKDRRSISSRCVVLS